MNLDRILELGSKLKEINSEKNIIVKAQKYEEAANLRSKEVEVIREFLGELKIFEQQNSKMFKNRIIFINGGVIPQSEVEDYVFKNMYKKYEASRNSSK